MVKRLGIAAPNEGIRVNQSSPRVPGQSPCWCARVMVPTCQRRSKIDPFPPRPPARTPGAPVPATHGKAAP